MDERNYEQKMADLGAIQSAMEGVDGRDLTRAEAAALYNSVKAKAEMYNATHATAAVPQEGQVPLGDPHSNIHFSIEGESMTGYLAELDKSGRITFMFGGDLGLANEVVRLAGESV